VEAALDRVAKGAGSQFDREVVEAFVAVAAREARAA
jgi:HD-GYP domain-containing protein (c-di-GMP phosphodiesterase class II)